MIDGSLRVRTNHHRPISSTLSNNTHQLVSFNLLSFFVILLKFQGSDLASQLHFPTQSYPCLTSHQSVPPNSHSETKSSPTLDPHDKFLTFPRSNYTSITIIIFIQAYKGKTRRFPYIRVPLLILWKGWTWETSKTQWRTQASSQVQAQGISMPSAQCLGGSRSHHYLSRVANNWHHAAMNSGPPASNQFTTHRATNPNTTFSSSHRYGPLWLQFVPFISSTKFGEVPEIGSFDFTPKYHLFASLQIPLVVLFQCSQVRLLPSPLQFVALIILSWELNISV